jgi:predicted phage terminase large subunit-like protein
MVNMPPRHGKSELLTRATPPWFLTRYPDRRVIVTGYEAEFAADFGADARRYIQTHPELGIYLDPSTASKSNWAILNHQGGLKTAGAGGPITGKGAHLFVIDDPVKSAEEADSDLVRDKHWKWWQGTVIPRREPGCVFIMVMTRWHEDDLAGRCLQENPDLWYQLSLPAIADHPEGSGLDQVGRLPGEPLWPERFDLPVLREIQQGMGSRWWSAEYQQKPTIQGGNMFKAQDFRYFTPQHTPNGLQYSYNAPGGVMKAVKAEALWCFTTSDLAATEKTSGDYTVFCVWGVTPDREILLLDLFRKRIESAEHESLVRALNNKHKIRYHGIEKSTFGLTLLTQLRRRGIATIELIPDKDKVARAWSAVALLEAGAIYFPQSAPWLTDFEQELQQFPNAAHDDMVDCLSYAARHMTDRIRPPKVEKDPEVYDINKVYTDRIIARRKKKLRTSASRWGNLL